MTGWWAIWWIFLSATPFVAWLDQSVVSSGQLSWATWALAAVCLSLCEDKPRRQVPLGTAAAVLVLAFVIQMAVVLPDVRWTAWTYSWGTVAAFGSAICWIVPVLWGTKAILENSFPVHHYLAAGLWAVLLFNLLIHLAHLFLGFDWWFIAECPGGAFPTVKVWAAFSAISLPILWERAWASFDWLLNSSEAGNLFSHPNRRGYRALAGVTVAGLVLFPAISGMWFGNSTSAWAATGAGLLWKCKSDNRKLLACFGLVVVAILLLLPQIFHQFGQQFHQTFTMQTSLSARVHTWLTCIHAIVQNPLGIGFAPDAYSRAVSGAPWPILPHPASDVLLVILQFGWAMAAVLFWIAYRGVCQLGEDGLSTAVVVFSVLACVQTSVSIPYTGILAWAVWMAWKIRQAEGVVCPIGQLREEYICEEKARDLQLADSY